MSHNGKIKGGNSLDSIKNNRFEFLDFIRVREEEIHNFKPVAGSFAVIQCSGKYLLCFNTWRNQWEIPAGKREDNETSKECAIRELYEETGQSENDLEFKGLLKVRNLTNANVKYNPVYFTSVKKLNPFKQNDETSKIKLWDLNEEIGYIDEIDFKIFDYIKES